MKEKNEFRFSGKRSRSFGIFLLIGSAVILFVAYILPILINKPFDATGLIIASFIAVPVPGIFLWVWLDTYYIIEERILKVKCGPFVWSIPISEINMIRLNQRTIGGTMKPTLSWKSIAVIYLNHRSLFITPDKQDIFIERLKFINNKIQIIDK